jgi:thymidine phosphorylase
MIGQTADLCPADKKLYALARCHGDGPFAAADHREHHEQKIGGVARPPGARCEVWQRSFHEDAGEAESLASGLTAVGREMGVDVSHILSPMDEPLGLSAGNALETIEAVETLQGRGPTDLVTLTLDLAEKVASAPRAQLSSGWRTGRVAEICGDG